MHIKIISFVVNAFLIYKLASRYKSDHDDDINENYTEERQPFDDNSEMSPR